MKRLFVCFLTGALFLPAPAFAHGVDVSDVTGRAGVRTVRFGYTDGESMLFAAVKVYPPSTPDATAQESMTDRDGYFSFVPFENGDWRLTAEDGMGHRGEIIIPVAGEGEDEGAEGHTIAAPRNNAASGKLPATVAAALGLSLILNIFALWHFAGLRKKRAAHAH
jgi:nickel transport protein